MSEPSADNGAEQPRVIWDGHQIARALARMAHQILEANSGITDVLLLGIPTRGVLLARRLGDAIRAAEGGEVAVGELDITMYRDDLRRQPTRAVGRTRIPRPIDGLHVVLVDDVLFSGRTVAAALDALKDLGRPRSVQLAVLVDRGLRELPIQANHVGKHLTSAADERVNVRLTEIDGQDAVTIERGGRP